MLINWSHNENNNNNNNEDSVSSTPKQIIFKIANRNLFVSIQQNPKEKGKETHLHINKLC